MIDLNLLTAVCYSAVVADCCDAVGLRDQTLEPGIAPMAGGGVLVGWARPMQACPVDAEPELPYDAEITYIDSLGTDEVVLGTGPTTTAIWGELFSTAAQARGARGAVIDGLVRDRRRIPIESGFVLFGRGGSPTDSLGRTSLVEPNAGLEIGGVLVNRGDLVVADLDGVVVVPRAAAAEVAERAVAKASTETQSRAMLESGVLLREAWMRHGVL